jgi:hypothetical protein
VAQNWQEYGYPDGSFRVTFLADPQIKTTTYQVTEDREVEAHVYFVRRDNAAFKVTVAELADAGRESAAVIDYAIKMLSKGGEVKVNPPHHIMSLFGRQLSIVGADGKLSIAPLVTQPVAQPHIEAGHDLGGVQVEIVTDGRSTGRCGSSNSAEIVVLLAEIEIAVLDAHTHLVSESIVESGANRVADMERVVVGECQGWRCAGRAT